MCGIVGYIGPSSASETAVECLKALEYRGYDSAGVGWIEDGIVHTCRKSGPVLNLQAALTSGEGPGHDVKHAGSLVAIAHTRWATHGSAEPRNAHPHCDCSNSIAVVHNGIIENYSELRLELTRLGHTFRSETDTEVISHLIEELLSRCLSSGISRDLPMGTVFLSAFQESLDRLRGSYAIAVIFSGTPDTIYAAMNGSVLLVGSTEKTAYLVSDTAAFGSEILEYRRLSNGDITVLNPETVCIYTGDAVEANRTTYPLRAHHQAPTLSNYDHFMLQEIHETPRAVRNTVTALLVPGGITEPVFLSEPTDLVPTLTGISEVKIVGCGSAFHVAMWGKLLVEQYLRIPAEACIASEFRYGSPLITSKTLVVAISQSGETADTIGSVQYAKEQGCRTLAIVNVEDSSLARLCDCSLLTRAGKEIGVASTKAYVAQLAAVAALILQWMSAHHQITPMVVREYQEALTAQSCLIADCIGLEDKIRQLANVIAAANSFFFLGRGFDYCAAAEGALKLKEIAYVHAEAYAAGEMKHGPLALITEESVTVAVCTQENTAEKMMSNMREVRSRGGKVLAVIQEGTTLAEDCADYTLELPPTTGAFMTIVTASALQLLAYYIALNLGRPIDKPRNLAKSVTVE